MSYYEYWWTWIHLLLWKFTIFFILLPHLSLLLKPSNKDTTSTIPLRLYLERSLMTYICKIQSSIHWHQDLWVQVLHSLHVASETPPLLFLLWSHWLFFIFLLCWILLFIQTNFFPAWELSFWASSLLILTS